MPTGKLNSMSVAKAKKPGMYGDGGGLWLQVVGGGGKSWVFRFTLHGRARAMGLGSVSTFSLAEARERATACRKLLSEGVDPIEARKVERAQQALDAAKAMTFEQCAEAYIAAHEAGWRDKRNAAHWRQTLRDIVYPTCGALPVAAVDTTLVIKALEPAWTTKTVTAVKVRGRIESILDWATTRGFRTGENPARWKGHLSNLLPKRSKISRIVHHPALPFAETSAFLKKLAEQPGVSADAIAFTIYTAARTGETIGATWGEIDLAAKVWTVPADRMKAGVEHRVPLPQPAMAILAKMAKVRRTTDPAEFVFPGMSRRRGLSRTSLLKTIVRMKRSGITVHGFRSTFRDWAAEQTNFPKEIAEAALAHLVGSDVERAYRRGDLFEKRRRLMDAWGEFATRGNASGARVVKLRSA